MEILKGLICATDTASIVLYVFDIILILVAIAFAVWLYLKYGTNNMQKQTKNKDKNHHDALNETPEHATKINDDTYLLDENQDANDGDDATELETEDEIQPASNRVEHFSSQLGLINKNMSEINKADVVLKSNEVEESKELINNQDLENFVVVDGVKKEKITQEKKITTDHGSTSYDSATNFVNLIKDEQEGNLKTTGRKKSSPTSSSKATKKTATASASKSKSATKTSSKSATKTKSQTKKTSAAKSSSKTTK